MFDKEINYDAGRKLATYKVDELTTKDIPLRHLPLFIAISQRYKFCHKLFKEIQDIHERLVSNRDVDERMSGPNPCSPLAATPTTLYLYSMQRECLTVKQPLKFLVLRI